MPGTYNVDLLMQIRERILTEPERHNQEMWATASQKPEGVDACGTAYCVAGWACVLDGQKLDWHVGDEHNWEAGRLADGETPISQHAQAVLQLSDENAFELFDSINSRPTVLAMLDRLIEAGRNGEYVPDEELRLLRS